MLDYVLKENNISNYEIYYNKYGKPYLNNGLYFNISHTKNIVVCVLSDKEIGIDIEYLRYSDNIVKKCFNQKEKEIIKNSNNKKEIFTIIWTIKESYVKLLGIGLEYGLINVDTLKLKKSIDVKKYNNYIVTISWEAVT